MSGFRNGGTAVGLFAVVIGMVGLAFASEPLYRIFCQVTGYAGTTQHYYRVAALMEPHEMMAEVVRGFQGVRLECAECHIEIRGLLGACRI